mmetsp:Transcript_43266/g.128166  ORF Transcript_43266/g.128166 Transcript_43266/m.128166 type:complete len:221 (+) Transcript_43266:1152-1814(+)
MRGPALLCCGVEGGVRSISGLAASRASSRCPAGMLALKFSSSAGGAAAASSCQKRSRASRDSSSPLIRWLSGSGLERHPKSPNGWEDLLGGPLAAEGLLGVRLITSMFSAVKVERSVHQRPPPWRFCMTLAAVPPPDFTAAERRMSAMSVRSRNARRALILSFQVGSWLSRPDPSSLSVVLALCSLLPLPPTTSPVLGFLMVMALLGPAAFPSLFGKAGP